MAAFVAGLPKEEWDDMVLPPIEFDKPIVTGDPWFDAKEAELFGQ